MLARLTLSFEAFHQQAVQRLADGIENINRAPRQASQTPAITCLAFIWCNRKTSPTGSSQNPLQRQRLVAPSSRQHDWLLGMSIIFHERETGYRWSLGSLS